jgi:hypothetical protein
MSPEKMDKILMEFHIILIFSYCFYLYPSANLYLDAELLE